MNPSQQKRPRCGGHKKQSVAAFLIKPQKNSGGPALGDQAAPGRL
jgi:hypothetical protein